MRRLLLLASFICVPAARAQTVEAYANLAIIPVSNAELYPYTSQQFTSFTVAGASFGGTLNFINFAVISAGLDASETVASTANFWLAGFRIMAKPPMLHLKPSFRLSVGEARLHPSGTFAIPNQGTQTINYQTFIYNAALAIDYRLTRLLDARVEVGDGRTLGQGSANPTNILTVNLGVVAHF